MQNKQSNYLKPEQTVGILREIADNGSFAEYCIAIDPKYQLEWFHAEIAKELEQATLRGYSDITFIIGGSLGLSPTVKKRANQLMSFGLLTFPHQLMRLVLVEQIYRAFMIQQGSPYHK